MSAENKKQALRWMAGVFADYVEACYFYRMPGEYAAITAESCIEEGDVVGRSAHARVLERRWTRVSWFVDRGHYVFTVHAPRLD